jgi:GNAT superfamily N-acetyltransferase
MIELTFDEYERVTPLFDGIEVYSMLPACVIEGRQPGHIYVDDPSAPAAAFVCQQTGYCYLGGDDDAFGDLSKDALILRAGRRHLDLSVTPGSFEERLHQAPPEASRAYEIMSFRLDESAFREALASLPPLPAGCRIERVTEAHADLAPGSGILAFFGSVERFSRHGLGFFLFDGDEVASHCVTSFVGSGACDASLVTREAFRRRGHATQVAAAFVSACLDEGLEPIWHTTPGNVASDRVAARLGFTAIGTYTMYEIQG